MSLQGEDLLREAKTGVRKAFGKKRVHLEPGYFVAVSFTRLDSPVFVIPNTRCDRPLYRVGLNVASDVDWEGTPGLAEFVLTENSNLFWGRFQISGGAAQLEHNLFAETTTRKQLALVVEYLAVRAVRLGVDLRLLDALIRPEAE